MRKPLVADLRLAQHQAFQSGRSLRFTMPLSVMRRVGQIKVAQAVELAQVDGALVGQRGVAEREAGQIRQVAQHVGDAVGDAAVRRKEDDGDDRLAGARVVAVRLAARLLDGGDGAGLVGGVDRRRRRGAKDEQQGDNGHGADSARDDP